MEEMMNNAAVNEPATAPEPVAADPAPAAAEPAPAETQPAATEPVLQPDAPKEVTSAVQDSGVKMTLVEDPITGRRSVVRDASNATPVKEEEEQQNLFAPDPEPEQKPAPEPEKKEAPKPSAPLAEYWKNQEGLMNGTVTEGDKPAPYSIDEFAQMVATNQQFDERRIPEELRKHYADVQVARAMQASTAQARAAEEAKKAAEQKMMTPEEEKEIRQEFFRELDRQAHAQALQDMGMTQEQFDQLKYDENADPQVVRDFDNSYAFHRQDLINKLQNDTAKQQYAKTQQQQVYKDIVDFTLQARQTEKNFKLIDAAMATRYKYLPFEQGNAIASAISALNNGNITPQQAGILKNYYEATRKEFYAYKNGLQANGKPTPAAPQPPVVESAGNGKEENQGPKYTVQDLRNATRPSDKQAIIAALLANRAR